MTLAIDNVWTCEGCYESFIPRKDNGILEDFMYSCKECS